ncbi:MAG: cyclic nucleotide-binding domain-containing protein [Candidatus Riflebacteria bacterium]|nr:cyclic nucleotide-binding domain-containing protein [Candidatus Riflebacteria bacterium]
MSRKVQGPMGDKQARDLFGKVYEDGAVLFREGDHGDSMYIIQDGSVELTASVGGSTTTLGVLGKGSFFGEMALFDDQPRSATAVVRGRSRLMVLHRETVKDRLAADPHIGLTLLRGMCQRLRSLHSSLEELIADGRIEQAKLSVALRAHSTH